MSRTEVLREVRILRFAELYGAWRSERVTQAEAAGVLGMSERMFRRWAVRYESGGRGGSSGLPPGIMTLTSREIPDADDWRR